MTHKLDNVKRERKTILLPILDPQDKEIKRMFSNVRDREMSSDKNGNVEFNLEVKKSESDGAIQLLVVL